MRKLLGTIGLAAVIGSTSLGGAQAAGWDFCRDYTRAAIRQVHLAHDSGRCMRWIDPYATRWSTNPDVHFRWCRGTSTWAAIHERDIRHGILYRCR